MTRRPGHDAVMRALRLALTIPDLKSVKLNVVVVKGLNEDEVPAFVELTRCVISISFASVTLTFDRHSALSVRFIEFMPFNGMYPSQMQPASSALRK